MHEHTRTRKGWTWNPRHWVWGSYTSPSGNYWIRWRGPRHRSSFTYWAHDHADGDTTHGCGVSFLIGGVK